MKHRGMEALMQQDAGTSEIRGADEMALRALVEQMEAGWNAHDGAAFAAPFAENADYIVVNALGLIVQSSCGMIRAATPEW